MNLPSHIFTKLDITSIIMCFTAGWVCFGVWVSCWPFNDKSSTKLTTHLLGILSYVSAANTATFPFTTSMIIFCLASLPLVGKGLTLLDNSSRPPGTIDTVVPYFCRLAYVLGAILM